MLTSSPPTQVVVLLDPLPCPPTGTQRSLLLVRLLFFRVQSVASSVPSCPVCFVSSSTQQTTSLVSLMPTKPTNLSLFLLACLLAGSFTVSPFHHTPHKTPTQHATHTRHTYTYTHHTHTAFPVAAPGSVRFLSTDVSGGKDVHPGQFTGESFLSALVSFCGSQHLLVSSTDLVYGPGKAKVALPAASPEEVVGWALHTVGVSQRNADKLLEQEIDGADIVHLSKLPESEIKAELLAAQLSLSAALKLSRAISDVGAAGTGTQ
jgi:hypothetical protein